MSSMIASKARYSLAALLGVLAAVFVALGLQAKPATAAECTDSLQAKIDAAPSGGIVKANACVYREQVTINKPITLQGQPGSEIRGSNVWQGWTSSGSYWYSKETLPGFPQSSPVAPCNPNTSRCQWPEQVFFDGKPLVQVASNPTTGQFAVNSGRRIILKDDPRGHVVEVSVRRHWVLGTMAADNVIVDGFTMKHAANEGRSGAIMNRKDRFDGGGNNWTVRNNKLSHTHGSVVSLKNAPGHKVLNNDISWGGQLGIHGAGNGSTVKGNKIHHNNTEDFSFRFEAGGIKVAPDTTNVVVDTNEFYDNNGNAIHFDMDTDLITISNNRIHHNARRGINYELSFGGKIFGNVIWENGWTTPEDGQGIVLNNSSTTEVYNNTLAWNADGIVVVSRDREETKWDKVRDVYIHDNNILGKDKHLGLAWIQGWSTQMFDPASNNRGERNKYWYTTSESSTERYRWKNTKYPKLALFNATGGEENGRYLTQSEKDTLVTNKAIPAAPESH